MLQQVSSTNLVSLFGSLALLSTWVCLLQSRNERLAADWQETRLFGAHFYPVLAIARRSSSNFGVTMHHLWRCLPSPHPLSSEDSFCHAMTLCVLCKCHKWLHRLCMGGMPWQCRWDSKKSFKSGSQSQDFEGRQASSRGSFAILPYCKRLLRMGGLGTQGKVRRPVFQLFQILSGSCCKWHLRASSTHHIHSCHMMGTLYSYSFKGLTCRGESWPVTLQNSEVLFVGWFFS